MPFEMNNVVWDDIDWLVPGVCVRNPHSGLRWRLLERQPNGNLRWVSLVSTEFMGSLTCMEYVMHRELCFSNPSPAFVEARANGPDLTDEATLGLLTKKLFDRVLVDEGNFVTRCRDSITVKVGDDTRTLFWFAGRAVAEALIHFSIPRRKPPRKPKGA